MSQSQKTVANPWTALRQVRKPLPRPVRVKDSKKLYIRTHERKKIAAEIRAVSER